MVKFSSSYICYRVALDGTLSERDNCDNKDAMLTWVSSAMGRFTTIKVINEQTLEERTFTDSGNDTWQRVA